MKRRSAFKLGLAAVLTAAIQTTPVAAADWEPKRPINIVVPFSAGGGVDTFARALAPAMQDSLGVPIVVVNKPGGGSLSGSAEAAGAKPDGQTLLLALPASILLRQMFQGSPVDPFEDLETISQVGSLVFALTVPKDSPIQSTQDLIDAAKANDGGLRWAHGGRGGALHVPGQSLLNENEVNAIDVPFQGGSKVRAAIIGKQVDYGILGIQQSFGFEEEMRVLSVFSSKRYPLASDIPTIQEEGVSVGDIAAPVSLMAPVGTPKEIISTLDKLMAEITTSEEFAEAMKPRGLAPDYQTGADAVETMRAVQASAESIINALKAKN